MSMSWGKGGKLLSLSWGGGGGRVEYALVWEVIAAKIHAPYSMIWGGGGGGGGGCEMLQIIT